MWAWYNSIYAAVKDATFLADLQAGNIVHTINSDMPHDEPLPGDTSLGALLGLLSAGLAFLNFPAGGASVKIFATAAQQAPAIGRILLNTGELASQVTPLDEIESSLSDLLQQFMGNLADALNQTQSDYDVVISHAANGSFIGDVQPLNILTIGFARYLKT